MTRITGSPRYSQVASPAAAAPPAAAARTATITGSPRYSQSRLACGCGSASGLRLARPQSYVTRGRGHAQGQDEASRLGRRFEPLGLGIGVGDDAGADLHRRGPVVADDRSDRDAGVEVAGVGDVADGAAVGPALGRLELVDDLHRADLRRAGEGAGRNARLPHVHRVGAG